jgi:hypothetical protein
MPISRFAQSQLLLALGVLVSVSSTAEARRWRYHGSYGYTLLKAARMNSRSFGSIALPVNGMADAPDDLSKSRQLFSRSAGGFKSTNGPPHDDLNGAKKRPRRKVESTISLRVLRVRGRVSELTWPSWLLRYAPI